MKIESRTVTTLALSIALIVGCSPRGGADPAGSASAGETVRSLADAYVSEYFEAFPQEATLAGVTDASHDRLPDNDLEALERWRAREDALLEELRVVDEGRLEGADAVTYGFLRNQLEAAVGFRLCRMELWNVSPTWTGWQSQMALLAGSQAVATAEERQAALQRFSQLPGYVDAEVANLREGLRQGYSAPATNVESVLRQMDALLEAPVEESPFVAMSDEVAAENVGFRTALIELEQEEIRPAIARYGDFLRDEYLSQARNEVGVSANPNGEACYRAAIRYHATVGIPPEEIHQIGFREMKKIRAEMQRIADRSFGGSEIAAAFERLKTEREFMFSDREELHRSAEAAVRRAEAAIPEWFGIIPAARVVVKPVPAFQEASSPDFYNSGSDDGTRPGVYYINLYQADLQSRASGMESTAFHETYPGHHFQGSIALERKGLHPISRYFYLSGFGEGWALYSERLADEMGLFSSDADRMGLLSAEAHRAARLVVDAGIHALGWSRQRAIDYLLQNTAMTEASAVAEIDRYIAVPGQATSYMLGNLEIRRLRELAAAGMGDAFDIRVFHDRVLEDGSVPLDMLAEKIQRWAEGGG